MLAGHHHSPPYRRRHPPLTSSLHRDSRRHELLDDLCVCCFVAALYTLTLHSADEVLGPAGVLFLQGGMILKGLLTAILWGLCLFAYYVGQLPSWTFLRFRQANCFSSTTIVVWFYPVRPSDGHNAKEILLLASYSLFWFLVLCIGSYWTLIAPGVLVKRGGHLRDPHMKKIKGFPMKPHKRAVEAVSGSDVESSDDANKRRQHMKDDPDDYKRDDYDVRPLSLVFPLSVRRLTVSTSRRTA